LAEVPSLGSLAHGIMFGIELVLLLPGLRPQIRRGLASVTPNGDPGAFVGLGLTVGALEANVNDDSNSLHLLFNCRITVSIAESPLT